jgi:hypothetical protein
MTIFFTQKTSEINQTTGQIAICHTRSLEVSVKITELALIALLSMQGSSCILSHLLPNQASIIQITVLTMSLLLFINIKNHKPRHSPAAERPAIPEGMIVAADRPIQNAALKKKLHEELLNAPPLTPSGKGAAEPAARKSRPRQESLDDKIDRFTEQLCDATVWKLLPKPIAKN